MSGALKSAAGFGGTYLDSIQFYFWENYQPEFDESTLQEGWAIAQIVEVNETTTFTLDVSIETSFPNSTLD